MSRHKSDMWNIYDKKNTKNKACSTKRERSRGFVILFTVVLSAIILSIALGVANISLREIKFGTSAKDANDAFFAADVGAECALYYDRSDQNKFPMGGLATPITCNNSSITVTKIAGVNSWSFTIIKLGSEKKDCVKVTINKTSFITNIISKGYKNATTTSCSQKPNTVERQLEINYQS